MKENTKTILAMIGLIAIGFVGGFFTHAQLTKKHLHQVAKEATLMGFENRLFRVIGADENQNRDAAKDQRPNHLRKRDGLRCHRIADHAKRRTEHGLTDILGYPLSRDPDRHHASSQERNDGEPSRTLGQKNGSGNTIRHGMGPLSKTPGQEKFLCCDKN